ncbi:hypothetical protein AAVH_25810 [Aphelenchoides avenae]|nr:hypothetical protein AAVH_25810 [Aphelenchus avenae]
MEDEIRKQLETLLQQQVIRPSNSPFASPIVMVKKADGKSFRMAIDYRRLNSLTCPATYVIPLMSDLTDKVPGHKLYSTFDFQSAFHMIPMAEEDKTAFITPYGLFEYLTMPFGINAGPVVMTRVMESLRQELTAAFFVYIDDVCLASNSESQHLKDIEQFLKVLEKYGLRLRLDKCHFGQPEVRYLGVLVSERGLRPDPSKITAVRSTKIPKTLTELRSFIGAVSYWRKFIPHFASIMHPLHQLTKNDGKIVGQDGKVIGVVGRWSAECQTAFETVIQRLITAPVLAAPWIGHPFIVETDASKIALGACLMQENRNKEVHPICYASKLTNKHQERFPSVELEALAVVWALQLFQPYLIGSGTTTVRSDNNAMCSLMKKRDATLTGRLARY